VITRDSWSQLRENGASPGVCPHTLLLDAVEEPDVRWVSLTSAEADAEELAAAEEADSALRVAEREEWIAEENELGSATEMELGVLVARAAKEVLLLPV
jgi:hypothetical protein